MRSFLPYLPGRSPAVHPSPGIRLISRKTGNVITKTEPMRRKIVSCSNQVSIGRYAYGTMGEKDLSGLNGQGPQPGLQPAAAVNRKIHGKGPWEGTPDRRATS